VRLVQISTTPGTYEAVVDVLDDEGIDYAVSDETSDREYTNVFFFPLPTNAVEPVIDRLRTAGVDDRAFTVITEARTVTSRQFDELSDRYAEEERSEDQIARAELRARAEELASTPRTYVLLTIVSAVVATAGLLLDSPATVVGSMVIAPLIGPAMAAAVGTVVDDAELFKRGVAYQGLGLGLVIAAAAAFSLAVQALNLVPPTLDPTQLGQVRERLAPDFLSLVVALGSGTAGAVSLTTGVSAALVGVMIAVALIPPAATVGIGIAYGLPSVALAASVLAAVNGLSINLAALVVFWWSGYEPVRLFRRNEAHTTTVQRVTVLIAVILLLSAFLGGVTYDSYENARTTGELRAEIGDLFEPGGPYAALTMVHVDVRMESRAATPAAPGRLILTDPTAISVTVGVPPDREVSGLVLEIDRIADRVVGSDVTTEVRYVKIQRA